MIAISIISLALSALAVLCLVHASIFSTCAGWHGDNIRYIYTDRAEYERRKANPPWYIRYSAWLDANIFRGKR